MKKPDAEVLAEIKRMLKEDAIQQRLAWANGDPASNLIMADTCDYYLAKIKELQGV